MRTNEERCQLMHEKAVLLAKEYRRKKIKITGAISMVSSLGLVLVMGIWIPKVPDSIAAATHYSGMNGSILTTNPVFSHIALALLSFMLGVSVTALCYQLKRWEEVKELDERRLY